MTKKFLYKDKASLNPIINILNEAGLALHIKSRTINDSAIPEVLGAVTGATTGAAAGLGLLSMLGVSGFSAAGITSGLATAGTLVGGGMVAGIGVLAAPALVLGVVGYGVVSNDKKRKLIKTKEALLQDAIKKHDAIIKELQNNLKQSEERAYYLNSLNILLQGIIKDLKADLT
ncbi:hypothetical protein Q0N30_12490 [Priestia megaterium]|uniref:hypothetical protein n=1 Tax=Priestia megaterium TaxID=1404 RepID=UPI003458618E